jgi:hypothetical protein
VDESALSVQNTPGTIGAPLPAIAEKGGLNSIALGLNHEERRFGQFALRFDLSPRARHSRFFAFFPK